MRDTIISNKTMKTKHVIWIASLFIILVIALVIVAFDQPTSTVAAAQNPRTTSISMQTTATVIPAGVSEIGSTDGILLMGFVIVLIVIIPVLVARKK